MVKNLPAKEETWVGPLGREDSLEKERATHSSILAWRIPWTEEPGGLQSTALQRVGCDWATDTFVLKINCWKVPGDSAVKHPPVMQESGRSLGEGNGNPLQYSCLGNPMDGGAWQSTVRGVTNESDTSQGLHNQDRRQKNSCNTTGETCKPLINIWKDSQETHEAPPSCGGYWGGGEHLKRFFAWLVVFELLDKILFIRHLKSLKLLLLL